MVVPLEGETLGGAVTVLAERLAASGHVLHPDRLRARVAEERPEDVVVLDGRAFVQHYRTDAVRALGIAIGVTSAAVRREPRGDEQRQPSARVVLVVVAPPRQAARHLQVVKALVRLLGDPVVVARVLSAGSPGSLLALDDFSAALPDQLTVRDLMTEQPRTTTADAPLRDAARQLLRGRLGALPVVDAGSQLIGLLGERELLREMLSTVPFDGQAPKPGPAGGATRQVRDVMTRQVICVGPDQPLAEVASLMSHRDVERVPVVHEGRLVGFLTRGDIVRKLLGS